MSAALTIARWCWPEEYWKTYGDESDSCLFGTESDFSADDWSDVNAAELVLIERGHAEAYGRALWERTADVPRNTPGMWMKYALIATAPLDARVRAMSAVIEKLEAGRG